LAGKADTPDVPASPMPAATKLTNRIVLIVMSPSIVACVRSVVCSITGGARPHVRMPPCLESYLSADAIVDKIIVRNLAFSKSQALICCSLICCFMNLGSLI
jgi:hypothetical protein